MARDAKVRIVLDANDQASGPIRQVQNALINLKSNMSGANQAASVLAGGLAGIAAVSGVNAIVGLGAAIADLGRQGEQAAILRDSFDQLASGVGQSSDDMLVSMRTASAGMISDQELILSANRAMMLGVADSSDEMSKLLEVAAVRGRAMGLSTSQAFNDLVTGLGRMSPLILDNLGIVTGGEAVFNAYAQSLGKTATALTDAERKQALFNKVVASTDTSGGIQVSQFEQMDAAIANLKENLGTIVAPIATEIAAGLAQGLSGLSDIIKTSTEQTDLTGAEQFGFAIGESIKAGIRAGMQGGSEGGFQISGLFGPGFEASAAEAARGTRAALGMDTRTEDEQRLDNLRRIAELQGQITDQYAQMRAASAAVDALQAAGEKGLAAGPQADMLARAEELRGLEDEYKSLIAVLGTVQGPLEEVNAAATETSSKFGGWDSNGVQNTAAAVRDVGGALDVAVPRTRLFTSGLSEIQTKAGATAGVIYNLTSAIQQLNTATGAGRANSDLLGGLTPQINSLTAGLVGNLGLDAALAKGEELKTQFYDQIELLRQQGYTTEQIKIAMDANIASTQEWASSLDNAGSSLRDAVSGLQGRVEGVLQDSLKVDQFKAADLFNPEELKAKKLKGDEIVSAEDMFPREDAINENARRVAAIMKEGIKNQPWLEEFKREAPAAFDEISKSDNPRLAAARMMIDFQNGLRPDLLDLGAIKEKIKTDIAGEAVMKATAAQITADLVKDTGGDSADIQAKVNKALGLGTAGTGITDGITGELTSATFQAQINTAATGAGKNWGNMFLTTVGDNVPKELVDLLVNLVTPGVQGNIQAAQGQTAPISWTDLHH